ncbi:MAG: T9SS type A sorting domain-containing protein [Saprospiraceae bacterium]
MKRSLISALASVFLCASLSAQFGLSLESGWNPTVIKDGIDQVHLTTGGLNNPQVHLFDIDGDGSEELYIFDRSGNIHLGFQQSDVPETPFIYDASLTAGWPAAASFVVPRDFDNDGVMDIFTYSSVPGKSSIEVHKGSRQNGRLSFELVEFPARPDDLLYYDNNGNQLIVYHFRTDIPSIEDFDNDGDLDVVTFEAGGSYMYYYENISTGGSNPADFLKFIRGARCYGGAYESAFDGTISLSPVAGECAQPFAPTTGGLGSRTGVHPGSTLTSADVDGDGDMDLLLGDVNSDFVTQLVNEPANGSAYFTEVTYDWPSTSTPVEVTFFPAVYPLDFEEDGVNSYLVSPSNPGVSQNYEVLWRYEPSGEIPGQLSLAQRDFLSNEAFDHGSGSHFAMADLNGDGIDDILVGNERYYDDSRTNFSRAELALYTSNASGGYAESTPAWLSQLNAELGANQLGLDPLLQDMDNDGDADLLLGSDLGVISYAENTGSGGVANFPSLTLSWMGMNAGVESSPAVIDVNDDGLLDLLVGIRQGSMSLYLNQGSASNPQFPSTATDAFYGEIDTRISGFNNSAYARPAAIEINGDPVLYVGSGQGRMIVYTGLPAGAGGVATISAELETGVGIDLDPCFGKDAQGVELTLIGNERGGLKAFRRDGVVNTSRPSAFAKTWTVFPNPTQGQLQFRDVEITDVLTVFTSTGQLVYQGNTTLFDASLASGVYTLQLVDASGLSRGSQRLVVLP